MNPSLHGDKPKINPLCYVPSTAFCLKSLLLNSFSRQPPQIFYVSLRRSQTIIWKSMLHGEKSRDLYNSGKYQLDKSSAEFINECRAMSMIFSVWVAAMVTRIPDVIRFLWQPHCRGTLRQLCEMYSCGQLFFFFFWAKEQETVLWVLQFLPWEQIGSLLNRYILIVIHIILLNRFCQLYICVYTQWWPIEPCMK